MPGVEVGLRRAPGAVWQALRDPEDAGRPLRLRLRRGLRLARRAAVPRPPVQAAWHGSPRRPEVRAVVIAGARVRAGLAPEWDQVRVRPDAVPPELFLRPTALLLVESGDDGLPGWVEQDPTARAPTAALTAVLGAATDAGVPTVLWSTTPGREAVVRDIELARLADVVATVDPDTVPVWRAQLGDGRVVVAGPAAQPRTARPPAGGARTRPARRRPYEASLLLDEAADSAASAVAARAALAATLREGVRVWRRSADGVPVACGDDTAHGPWTAVAPYERLAAVPALSRVLLDAVAPDRGVPTWRLLEAGAAQTPVVSTPYALLAPDLAAAVVQEADPAAYRLQVLTHARQPELRDRAGLRLQRAVLGSHSYSHRVDAMLGALGTPHPGPEPSVSAVVSTNRPHEIAGLLADVARQSHRPLELVLVLHGLELDPAVVTRRAHDAGVPSVTTLCAAADLTLGACLNLGLDAAGGRYIAKMDDDDVYGAHYLRDLVAAADATQAPVVGKWAHYVWLEESGAVVLRFPGAENTYSRLVQGGSLLMTGDVARGLRFADLPRGVDTDLLHRVRAEGLQIYSADRFNFVSVRRSSKAGHTYQATDPELLTGSAVLEFFGDPRPHVEV